MKSVFPALFDLTSYHVCTLSFHAPGHAAAWDEDCALRTLRAFARAERNPRLVELVNGARTHGLTVLLDDDTFSLGVGRGSRTWPLAALPAPAQVDWAVLHEAPIALVTGSNGKTTTTRLLAACLRARGERGPVITLICDGGERYRETYYNDAWLASEGFDVAGEQTRLEQIIQSGRWVDA